MPTVTDVLNVARSQLGQTEQPSGSNRTAYGRAYGMDGNAWCSIFVWWVFAQVGIDLKAEVAGGYSDCDTALAGYQRRGWLVPKMEARPGDVVLYDLSRKDGAGADHTGIIELVSPAGVTCIEGNTSQHGSQTNGGAVLRKSRPWAAVKAVGRVPLLGASSTPAPTPPATPPTPPTPKKEKRVELVRLADGSIWKTDGLHRIHITDPAHVEVLRFTGVPYSEVTDQAWSWIFTATTHELAGG